jgi:2-polyprenyl-3-methyl-5-hydroxy-6-metoxy-1,4-benzoquinol methylase
MVNHWTEKIFLENPLLFLPILQRRLSFTENEVQTLLGIFKEFNVPENGCILDLACGIGRHSILLAEAGYNLVGIDISPEYIDIAKKISKERGVDKKCQFYVGDMRYLKNSIVDEKFDVVISMFTSLGYYDKQTDFNILKQTNELSSKNCILIIEIMNKNYIAKYVRKTWHEIPGILLHLEEPSFDLENSRLRAIWRVYKPVGNDLNFLGKIEFNNLVYDINELKDLVEKSGWTYEISFGGFDLSSLRPESRRILLVASASPEKL